MIRQIISFMIILSFTSFLAACGDTWHGAKKDTGDNMEKTGSAIEKAGENIKK